MDFVYTIAVLLSALAAVLAWVAKLRWSKQYTSAKDAELNALRQQLALKDLRIEILETQQSERILLKEDRISNLEGEIQAHKAISERIIQNQKDYYEQTIRLLEIKLRETTGHFSHIQELSTESLRDEIRQLAGTGWVRIPLFREGPGLFVGRITDERLLQPGVPFYFGLDLRGRVEDVVARSIMVSSSTEDIHSLFSSVAHRVAVRFPPRAPKSLPRYPRVSYFELSTQGPSWDDVRRDRTIAIMIPVDLATEPEPVLVAHPF